MKKLALLLSVLMIAPLVAMSSDDERKNLIDEYSVIYRTIITRSIPEIPEESLTYQVESAIEREGLRTMTLEQLREKLKESRNQLTEKKEAYRSGSMEKL